MNQGVYEIVHLDTGRQYIGSASTTFAKRWKLHRHQLRRGTHHSRHLQNAWNKYGEQAFAFRKLVICAPADVLMYEQRLLDGLKPAFNVAPIAGSAKGVRHTDETKKAMSAAARKWRKKHEWQGRMLCMSDIADEVGVDARVIQSRIAIGMTLQEAVERGEPKVVPLTHDGRTMTRKEWAAELGMHPRRLSYWVAGGMTIADCIARLNRESKAMTFPELCRQFGIYHRTVKARLRNGESLSSALMREPAPSYKNLTRWKKKHGATA